LILEYLFKRAKKLMVAREKGIVFYVIIKLTPGETKNLPACDLDWTV
jgi:hypothetical protein